MAADNSLRQEANARHGDAGKPYQCHTWAAPPGSAWGIDYGYCRTSLDALLGHIDPRCPKDCPHKASESTVVKFDKLFHWRGAAAAAKWAREQKGQSK